MKEPPAREPDNATGRSTGETHHESALHRLASNRLRLAASILVGGLLAIGVVLLVGHAAGYAKLIARLRQASTGWLLVCLAGQVVSITGYVLAFRHVAAIRRGPRLSVGTTTRVTFASIGATRLVAAGGVGGLAVSYWALRHAGMEKRESFVRVLALNTLLYAVFAAFAWLAALVVILPPGSAHFALTLPWLLVVPACVLAARWVSDPRRVARMSAEHGGNVLRRGLASAIAGVAEVREIVGRPRENAPVLGGAALYWIGDMTCLWAGLRAFGVGPSVHATVLAYSTGYVATVLPLPTGGVGGVDAAMTYALTIVGLRLEDALSGVIAYRFFEFWLPTIPAAWAFFTISRTGRALERESGSRLETSAARGI